MSLMSLISLTPQMLPASQISLRAITLGRSAKLRMRDCDRSAATGAACARDERHARVAASDTPKRKWRGGASGTQTDRRRFSC
jgi:hypothetical protein